MSNNFEKAMLWCSKLLNLDYISLLEAAGKTGVALLSKNTPVDTGKTADSWYYEIDKSVKDAPTLIFKNSNMAGSVSVPILIHYGHVSRGGTWVEGRDFINPTLEPVFKDLSDTIWQEVVKT